MNPLQWKVLGSTFLKQLYINCFLPFGISSAPGIFSRFSDATRWIAENYFGFLVGNLIDDFLVVSTAKTIAEAIKEMQIFQDILHSLGWITNAKKRIDPTRLIKWLGIIFNSQERSISISQEKCTLDFRIILR